MELDSKIKQQLAEMHLDFEKGGKLLPRARLDECFNTFRQHFGPELLQTLDGQDLLEKMHAHGNQDSLVYWLEFKDDEELPAIFGSIAGGTALKFGIYRSIETSEWVTGSPRAKQILSTEEAISYAIKHRDQLIRGCDILADLPDNADDDDYLKLQENLNKEAPDVSNLAWGHKYFYMMFPSKLDDFHNSQYQRFHLIKLLQMPPQTEGRYVAAGRYVAIALQLDMPLNHLTAILNYRNGRPNRYWMVGTRISDVFCWDPMREGNYVAVGWSDVGDLSHATYKKESKAQIRELMEQHYPNNPPTIGRETQQLFNFVTAFNEGDIVLASDEAKILGIGKITGEYSFEPSSNAAHRRSVEWLSIGEWKMPEPEGLGTTVHEVKKFPKNLISVEKRILSPEPIVKPATLRMSGIPGRIYDVLERKRQVILYGPPGTGKTYWAELSACELAARYNFKKPLSGLTSSENSEILGDNAQLSGFLRTCCFHPEYGYGDFIEGYRPSKENDKVQFKLRDGIFKKLCSDAAQNQEKRFFLIIDEINRGDIPRIFGELLTIIEANKRGKSLLLPLSEKPFKVPDNIMIIGTMNTADRSIALLDTALRRRFGFIELMPDISVIEDIVLEGIPIRLWLNSLNERICSHIGRDARNLQIGHSYLMADGKTINSFKDFARIIREDIIPLLEEYCYEDYMILEKLLGKSLVDGSNMNIHNNLFEDAERAHLVSALLAPCPDISTSYQAVDAGAEKPEDDEEETEETLKSTDKLE